MNKRKKSSNNRNPRIKPRSSVTTTLPLCVMAGTALIVLVAFIAYFPSLKGDFILDDDLLVTENMLITSPDGLYWFWCTTQSQDYWPVTNTTLWIEWRLWRMHPAGFHVTNLLLHIVEALLIWLILRKLSIPGAFLTALIFAVHPVNAESVAWIAQRKNTMAMLFFLLSILCYLKLEMQELSLQNSLHQLPILLASRPAPLFYWLSLLAFVLSMLSKGSVAVLPVLLLGIVWWLRPLAWRDLVLTAPFFVIGAVLAIVNVWFQTHGADVAYRTAGFAERLLGASGVVWFYIYKALLPINLIFVYPQWNIHVDSLRWWLPLFAAMVVTAVLWWYRKSWSRPFLFAWGFFCVSLLPVMGFADVGFMEHSLVADRYQHIAIIGAIALVAAGWSIWRESMSGTARRAAISIVLVAVGTLAFLTWQRSVLFSDKIALYQATVDKNPNSWLAQDNLGLALHDKGLFSAAVEHYKQALQLKPGHAEAHNNFGNTLLQINRPQEAIEEYEQAIKLKSNYYKAYFNLGNAYKAIGEYQKALEHYQEALRINPNLAEAYYNIGVTLIQMGRSEESADFLQRAVLLNPNYSEAYNSLGIVLVQRGRPQEAIDHFNMALRIKPDNILVWQNMAVAYSVLRRPSDAIAASQKALDLAKSQGQTAQAKQIEAWLNAYIRKEVGGGRPEAGGEKFKTDH